MEESFPGAISVQSVQKGGDNRKNVWWYSEEKRCYVRLFESRNDLNDQISSQSSFTVGKKLVTPPDETMQVTINMSTYTRPSLRASLSPQNTER